MWWRRMVCVFNTCKLINEFLIKKVFPSSTDIFIILFKDVHVPTAVPYCVREKQYSFTLGPFKNKSIINCNILILASVAAILISESGTVSHVTIIHHVTWLLPVFTGNCYELLQVFAKRSEILSIKKVLSSYQSL